MKTLFPVVVCSSDQRVTSCLVILPSNLSLYLSGITCELLTQVNDELL